jgi:hypothetical protein
VVTPMSERASENLGAGGESRTPSPVAPDGPKSAWYHADFCHAYAWVYEDGDKLRVRWGARTGTDLMLHRKSDCDRCQTLYRERETGRHGEFLMDKPPAEFSSAESFMATLIEIAKYVPGLRDDDDAASPSSDGAA